MIGLRWSCSFFAVLSATALPALAAAVQIDMNKISAGGVEDKVGIVTAADSSQGLVLTVKVDGFSGTHGFHVHQIGNCGPAEKNGKMEAGVAAGDHYDPDNSRSHQGPDGKGHAGDLPALKLGSGEAVVVAPRLTLEMIRGRALIIHEGGDTYSDNPELGGGKSRIACGVVPKT